MIRRTLLIASAIIASVVITACSDTTAPKQLAAGLERLASEADNATNLFYTTAGAGAEVFAIKVTGKRITTTDIGPTNEETALHWRCHLGDAVQHVRTTLRHQQLATIDPTTGRATLFGAAVPGLAVMAMAFAREGTLYAVGDCNPNANFECTPGFGPQLQLTLHGQ